MVNELPDLIDRFGDSIRTPFPMHYEGLKYQEIANEFGLPLGTVKSRIFFTRQESKAQIKRRYRHVDEMLLRA